MFRILVIALLGVLAGCDRSASATDATVAQEAGIDVRFPVHIGKVKTQLRMAVTDLEKSQGLMGVTKLPESEGMAFMYAVPLQMNFWMKDTPIDLDIAFVLTDGTIDEIRTMSAEDTRDTFSRSSQVSCAIEMPAGWFARAGVKSGDKVDLRDLRQALVTRGFKAERYLK